MLDIQALSVIIPVYNGQGSLNELWRRLTLTLDTLVKEFEIVFVDDGSHDESWKILANLAGSDTRVKSIRLMRNYGQHNALLCGIRAAIYPYVLTMDDDLQHPPEEIFKLLEGLQHGYDVVYGTFPGQAHGLLRSLASTTTKLVMQNAMGVTSARGVSAFRLFRTDLRKAFDGYQGALPNLDVMLSWGTKRFGIVPVRHDTRGAGKSGYTVYKLIIHSMNMITGFSVLPLQIASLLGFVLTFGGFLLLTWVLARYLLHGMVVQGFAFLASLICIFSGAQLFCLGIIGEYIARVHLRLMDKPAYTVAQSLNL